VDTLLFIRYFREWLAKVTASRFRYSGWAIIAVCLFLGTGVKAQNVTSKPEITDSVLTILNPFNTIEQSNGVLLSADRRGFFYVADINGNIQQFKSNAEKGLLYSPPQQTRPTVLDAWNGLSILVFSLGFQEFTLLDRFLSAEKATPIPNSESGFAAMAAISTDNNLWVLDMSNFSVNKFQLNTGRLLFSNPLDLKLKEELGEPVGLTEYQNYLYLTDASKNVYLFDNSGVFIQKLGISFVPLAFANDYLIRLTNNKIIFEPLPRGKQKKPIKMGLNLKEQPLAVSFSNGRLCVLTKTKLYFFNLELP